MDLLPNFFCHYVSYVELHVDYNKQGVNTMAIDIAINPSKQIRTAEPMTIIKSLGIKSLISLVEHMTNVLYLHEPPVSRSGETLQIYPFIVIYDKTVLAFGDILNPNSYMSATINTNPSVLYLYVNYEWKSDNNQQHPAMLRITDHPINASHTQLLLQYYWSSGKIVKSEYQVSAIKVKGPSKISTWNPRSEFHIVGGVEISQDYGKDSYLSFHNAGSRKCHLVIDGDVYANEGQKQLAYNDLTNVSDDDFRQKAQSAGISSKKIDITVFPTNQKSPSPSAFKDGLYGFDAYNSTDFPARYYSGFVVMEGTGTRGAQFAIGWNGETGGPTDVAVRIKDDTQSDWGSWSHLAFSDLRNVVFNEHYYVVTTTDANNNRRTYSIGFSISHPSHLEVYYNRLRLIPNYDYTVNVSNSTITLKSNFPAVKANDVLFFRAPKKE